MIQLDKSAADIRQLFGMSEERFESMHKKFEEIENRHAEEMAGDLLKFLKNEPNARTGIDRVKILCDFLELAATPHEQLFCSMQASVCIINLRRLLDMTVSGLMKTI